MDMLAIIAASRRRTSSSYDADAQTWFDAVVAAGSSITTANKAAVSAFVAGCKTDSNWDKIKSLSLYAGPDSYAGGIIPVKGPSPTVVGSISAGWSRLTGIAQPAVPASNYIDTNITGDSAMVFASATDFCHGCYLTAPSSSTAAATYYGGTLTNGKVSMQQSATEIRIYHGNNQQAHTITSSSYVGFVGASRTGATTCETRCAGNALNPVATATATATDDILIFRRGVSTYSGYTLGATWFGHGLTNQGSLRTRLDTLFAALT